MRRPHTFPAAELRKMPNAVNGKGFRPYLIDFILPAQSTSLLGGPSGAGKTRWLFDTLLQWERGKPILGFASHPVPWLYISADRSIASVRETLHTMNIDAERINILPAWDEEMGICAVLDGIEKAGRPLVVWEAFASFVEPPGNSKCVKQHLQRVERLNRKGYTCLGIVEQPKMKPYEKYENPRQRVSGAAAWAHFTDTIFMLDLANPKEVTDPSRLLHIAPRNCPAITQTLSFDPAGHLVETAQALFKEEQPGRVTH